MLTHLFDRIVLSVDSLPLVVVYAIVAAWVGGENLGIPLPWELMLLFAGSLVGLGRLNFLLALLALVLASLICAAVAYRVGQRAGAHALARLGRRIGVTHERIDALDAWLRLRGVAGIAFARIIPGIRLFSSYVMGIAGVRPLTFTVGVVGGTLIYSSIWMLAGVLLGSNYRAPLHYLDMLGVYGLPLAAALIIAGLAAHHVVGRHAFDRFAAPHMLQSASHRTAPGGVVAGPPQGSGAATGSLLRHVGPAVALSPARVHPGAVGSAATFLRSTASTPSRRFFRALDASDRRLASAVGLRGSALLAQVRAPWPVRVRMLVGVAWVALATVMLLLAASAHRYAAFPLDETVTRALLPLRGTVLAALVYPAGDLQWYLPTAIAYVIIFATLLLLRLFGAALFVALSSFGTDLVNLIVNTLVDRPRPNGVTIPSFTAANLGHASFPSGHVAHAVGLYGFLFFLCLLAGRARPQLTPWLLAIQALCVYFLAFVGFSRVLEGQHWPSDVVAGYAVGALVVTLAIALYHRVAVRADATHPARQHSAARMAAARQRATRATVPPTSSLRNLPLRWLKGREEFYDA